MKRNAVYALAGAIVLAMPLVAVLGNATPSQADSVVAQAPAGQDQNRRQGRQAIWEQLNLTEQQRSQIEAIRQAKRQEMEAVLTPEQRSQLEAARQSGNPRGAMRNLNLTEAQKTQLRQIRESGRQQMEAVLTPEQRQILESARQNRQQNRPNRQGQGLRP